MRCLKRILNIRWNGVRELKIINLHVRKKFNNIDTIKNTISKRSSIFIGEIIRIPYKFVPAKLISAFQMRKMPVSRPNITMRHSFISDIENMISNIDSAGSFNSLLIQPLMKLDGHNV